MPTRDCRSTSGSSSSDRCCAVRVPSGRQWLARIKAGQQEGRFDAIVGEIDKIEPGRAGLRVYVKSKSGEDPGWLDVTGVTAGTGFNKSVLTLPLIRRLVEFYKVPVVEGRLRLQTNCGVPGLDLPESRLCCMGLIANNVIPHGDTIAGLKFIARRFVSDCARAEKLKKRSVHRRVCRSSTRWGATWLRHSEPCPRPSSSRRGRSPCVQPSSAGFRPDGRS